MDYLVKRISVILSVIYAMHIMTRIREKQRIGKRMVKSQREIREEYGLYDWKQVQGIE